MSGPRGWVARLAAGRVGSPAGPVPAPPVRSPGPVRPGPPGRGPLAEPRPRAGAAAPEPKGPALRIVLVSRDTMLAGALRTLIMAPGSVRLLDWHADELERAIRHADVVIVDTPPDLHERTFALLDGRFLGRTIVLLQEGEPEDALPSGLAPAVLYRPLQIGELWTAITRSPSAAPPEPQPEAQAAPEAEPEGPGEPEAEAPEAEPAEAPAGLPVAPSGRLIGFSGRELEPVIGPGQVAPGMDAATLERLRRWGTRRQPAGDQPGPAGPAARRPLVRWPRPDVAGRVARTGRALVPWPVAGRVARTGRALVRWPRPDVAGWAGRTGRALAERRPKLQAGRLVRPAVMRVGGLARPAVGGLARPAVVVVMAAAVGFGAAGWRGPGGPDTAAGEVAVARAVGAPGSGLVVPDPRVGPVGPLHTVAVDGWLRAGGGEAEASLDAAIRAARAPSRFLLAAAVALSVLLSLLLMRVGPGTGAAAGPGPAPPHGASRPAGREPPAASGTPESGPRGGGRWRLGVAVLAGLLVALDPVMVRGGRLATGTILAVVLGLGTLALAWAVPERPARWWLAAVGAGSGLALLASPLTLPVLAVPAVAALLEGRRRAAGRALGALGIGAALWLALPLWVAGQDLRPGQAGVLLGGPPGRGSLGAALAAFPLSWLLAAAGLAAAALVWRRRRTRAAGVRPAAARLLAWVATTAAGALAALAVGYPVDQALPFAVPAAAAAVALAFAEAGPLARAPARVGRLALAALGVAVAGLVVAQGLDWRSRYAGRPDDALGQLVAVVDAQLADCSVVDAGGPHARARLLAAGTTVTQFSSGPAAQAAGVRYFALTDAARSGGPTAPAVATWVRERGDRVAEHPSPSFARVELWRVDADALDPAADQLPVPGGVFSNVVGSACGGYRVADTQAGAFYAAYSALGGKAVLGRPLGSVWSSDGPALQAFDTMVLGATAEGRGRVPQVQPVDLTLLLYKLDREALARADMPVPSAPTPRTDAQARTLLGDEAIARAYLGVAPSLASADDWRRARERFGRPVGMPQVMPDGAVRQPFERVVLELPADGGAVRPAALGRIALQIGLVPGEARRLEPVPGLPAQPTATRVEPAPLLWLLAALAALLALGTGLGALAARRRGR